MLFRAIDTYLPYASEKFLPRLHKYIKTINTRRKLVAERYAESEGLESNSIQLFKQIIGDSDIDSLIKMTNDSDRYINTLQYTAEGLDNLFDQTATGKTYGNMFVKYPAHKCREYLVPIRRLDYLSELPLEQDWVFWQDVRSVRLLDIDSYELSFNTYTDQIIFKYDLPSRAVIGIDTITMVLQYVKYCLTFNNTEEKLPLQLYLHRYILSGILNDLENLWLRNLYLNFVSTGNFSEKDNIVSDNTFYGFIGSEYDQAILEIRNLFRNCANNNITAPVVLSSLYLSDKSVVSYLKDILNRATINNSRQYHWLEFLRDLNWLKLIYKTYQLQNNTVYFKNLTKALRRDLPILMNSRFWNNCHDNDTRDFIETEMSTLIAELE